MNQVELLRIAARCGASTTLTTGLSTHTYVGKAEFNLAGLSVFADKIGQQAILDATKRISVADRLPEEKVMVIGFWDIQDETFSSIQSCYFECGQWFTFNCGSYDARLIAPVCWASVPE